MSLPPAVARLITALREAGVAVGMTDIERLRRVFELGPPGDRLGSVLAAVLVKTDADRARFERVFAAWIDETEEAVDQVELRLQREAGIVEPPDPGPGPGPDDEPAPSGPGNRPWAPLVALAVTLLGLAGLVWWLIPPGSPPAPDAAVVVRHRPDAGPGPAGTEAAAEQPSACRPAALREYTFDAPVPVLSATPGTTWAGWWPLGLGVVGLLGLLGVWLGWRDRHIVPPAAPLSTGSGPSRALLAPAVLRGPALLDRRQQDALVWGIGRFVSEQPTRRLDIAATVRDTAGHAGIPHVHFHRARYHREVWLWIDELADDPAIARLADEIADTLEASGLPVERALFRGVPSRLIAPGSGNGGLESSPRELDDRRHTATVAILTDGRVLLARARARGPGKQRVQALLRDLSHWPRLALVDCSDRPGELAALAAPHALAVVEPAALASYLADSRSRGDRAVAVDGREVVEWAAVCAVSPGPVAEDTALAALRALDLPVSPWALARLRSDASSASGQLTWSEERRVERLQWLRAAETGERSLLDRAVAFWKDRYDAEDRRRLADPSASWADSPARHRLRIERAVLDLWRDPVAAAAALHELWDGPDGRRGAVIRGHLAQRSPADCPAPGSVRLLWSTDECPAVELVMLQSMGLAGVRAGSPRRPGRLWLGLGWIAGLAVGTLLVAARLWVEPPPGPVIASLERSDAWPAKVPDPDGDGWQVTVATPQSQAALRVEPGATVQVAWQARETGCVADLPGGTLWRCGAEFQTPPTRGTPGRRVVILDAGDRAEQSDMAEILALALLDCGEADAVYRGGEAGWANDRAAVFGASSDGEAVTRIAGDAMADQLQRLRRAGRCGSGVMFATIEGGTFWMGTRDDDPDPEPYSDEKPAHRVTLDGFAMARCEVTNRQYEAFLAATGREDERSRRDDSRFNQPAQPVVGVSWHEADAYCRYFGYQLPTEAQWEYACRGGDHRGPWPGVVGGKGELGAYGWFDENAGSTTHAVGTKKPTESGLHDMHGNAWEWARDWYGSYPADEQTNPEGPSDERAAIVEWPDRSGPARLLRGGSFGDRAGFLRCADRDRNLPEFRYLFIGFRCVRGVPRQPRVLKY